MADQGSIDDLLSKEIDQNKVSALVGSLESQLASTSGKESHKAASGSSYNNNHIGGNVSVDTVNSTNAGSVAPRPQQTVQSVHGLVTQPKILSSNKSLPINTSIVNSSLKGNIGNPQIIGISSIINANSQNRTNSNSSTSLPNSSSLPVSKQISSSPSIRIVTNSPKTPNSALHNPGQVGSQILNSAMSQNSTTVRPTQPLTRVNISAASGASTAMHNLATIAAEQKPLTVLPNGSAHLQNVQHKDGSVIPQQIIVKSDANHVVKNPLGRSDIPMSNSVIQGLAQGIRQPSQIITGGLQQIVKGVSSSNNTNVVTVRTNTSNAQHVVVRATVATTLANSSPSVQVVNATTGTPSTIRPALSPQIRPVRIAQQPTIAPRQQTSQTGTLTIPHGALLMRSNETGQLVLVSASQTVLQQSPSSNSVITTMAPSGYRLQNVRPLASQASVRAAGSGQTVVTIHPQGTPQLQQPIQVRSGQAISTVVPTTNLQQRLQGPTASVIGQPAPSVTQATPTTVSGGVLFAGGEMNKAMLENVKKCKNFLQTLIKLAYSQPQQTVKNVQALIQGLINGKVEPEMFTERLQHELQSSPQPYLVPFLKKSLPLLRQSMIQGRMTIEGVKPPPLEVVAQAQTVAPTPATTQAVATQQVITASGTLTQRPVMAPRTVIAPVQQQKLRPSPGPVSSKVAAIRHPVSQVAIAPGGNKVVVQSQLPRQALPPQLSQVPTKVPPRPSPQTVRVTKPAASTAVVKPEQVAPAGHREKRKFESLKDGDDDINDVATMGGVNLSEESKNILATTNADSIGAQTRSCKDEIFLASSPLHKKITAIAKKYGIEDIQPAVVNIISHATQERLRDMVSKLSTIAEHRVEIYKMDNRFEAESETKQKLKFLEELDKLERKRHEEQEREKLMRAIKSRSKNEDPEQLQLKRKAKELQEAEAEELRQKEANLTALAAIGPRKKRKLDFSDSSKSWSSTGSNSVALNASSSRPTVMRPRTKRVNLRDVQFLLESERPTRKSDLLYKTFLK